MLNNLNEIQELRLEMTKINGSCLDHCASIRSLDIDMLGNVSFHDWQIFMIRRSKRIE